MRGGKISIQYSPQGVTSPQNHAMIKKIKIKNEIHEKPPQDTEVLLFDIDYSINFLRYSSMASATE